jgi:hypothetical protein
VAKEVSLRFGTLLLIGGFIAAVTLLTLYAYARLVPLRSPYEFVTLAHIEESMFPEVFGRSDSSRFVVIP